jgi:hypothetical protein
MGSALAKCWLLFALLLVSSCAATGRIPAQFAQTDEVLVNVGIPLTAIEREARRLAQHSKLIKRIDYIRVDPETRMLSLKGVVHYPLDQLFHFGSSTPPGAPQDHTVELSFSFPRPRNSARPAFSGSAFTVSA